MASRLMGMPDGALIFGCCSGVFLKDYGGFPIAVATVLAAEGGVPDETTLVAAALHDTVEDTPVWDL